MDKNLKLFSVRYRASKYRNTLKFKKNIKQISRQNKKLRGVVESKIEKHCGNSNDLRKESVLETQESISLPKNEINNQNTNSDSSDSSDECNNAEIYEENKSNDVSKKVYEQYEDNVNDPEIHTETESTNADEEKKLRARALEYQIPHLTLNKLLNILRARLIPSLL